MAGYHQGEESVAGEELRIVLLGKTGSGKSSAGNTILGNDAFHICCGGKADTSDCSRIEGIIDHDQKVAIIDTPGLFDPDRSKKDLKNEIVSCLTECAPGPHVFIFMLKVARYTKEEQDTVKELLKWFGKDALKHTVLLFTHGDELADGMTINDFVEGTPSLKKLVDVNDMSSRIHVIDNKYWVPGKASDSDDRSNSVQVKKLMHTINNIVREGGIYTNETLEKVGEAIKAEVENIKRERGENHDISEIRKHARMRVKNRMLNLVAGTSTGVLLGALLGVSVGAVLPVVVVAGLITRACKAVRGTTPRRGGLETEVGREQMAAVKAAQIGAGAAGGIMGGLVAGLEIGAEVALGTAVASGIGVAAVVAGGVLAVGGIIGGGITGAKAAKRSDNADKAANEAAQSVLEQARDVVKSTWERTQAKKPGSDYEPLMNE